MKNHKNNGFEVRSFTQENLAYSLANDYFSTKSIKKNQGKQLKYFTEYFSGENESGIKAETIVIENEYISKAFFQDYVYYYSQCFKDYKKKCKRVHFFNSKFNNEEFLNELLNNDQKHLTNETYLGYIVVKHLPNVVIGTTILKPYQSNEIYKRVHNSVREYDVNLFGRNLIIKSLVFQEQDRVVSACATSALWVAFHKTSKLFDTKSPTPVEITNSTKNLFIDAGRVIPNEGLDVFQIGTAIENTGLVAELRNEEILKDIDWLKTFIYSYNKMGLPIIMGIKLLEKGRTNDSQENYHLITITGYRENNINFGERKSEMSTIAKKINRFYAHDDLIGPFSRLGFRKILDESYGKENKNKTKLETSWIEENGENLIADVVFVFVPIFSGIRIKFENVYKIVLLLDYYLNEVAETVNNEEIVWDIFLEQSNRYKNEIISNKKIRKGLKKYILTNSLPKYIWIAKAFIKNDIIFEIIFDSTDLGNGIFCRSVHIYSSVLRKNIKLDIDKSEKTLRFRKFFYDELSPVVLKFIKEAIKR
jgi:hypothetical protein